METQVFGISTDFIASQKKFAQEVKASFPLLSDHSRKVSKEYGVLMENGLANRATFVIDTEGKIVHIEEGKTAVDPSGAELACSRLKRK
jgi:peroxiredoxin Q/BCP